MEWATTSNEDILEDDGLQVTRGEAVDEPTISKQV